MPSLQSYFEKYHSLIRMDYDSNAELAQKRDILLSRIDSYLDKHSLPSYERILQGSYKMKTGVKPPTGRDYDIDVGLAFEFDTSVDPSSVRGWVFSALKTHPAKLVQEKGPCIRVTYADGYHVDLVIYRALPDSDPTHLAHKDRGWVSADPKALLRHVQNAADRFTGTEGNTGIDQLRRIVRYLKRWDDIALPEGTNGKPSGLAYTLLSISTLVAPVTSFDGKPDDCTALLNVATSAAASARLTAAKPTPEYEDMFGGLTGEEDVALRERFARLRDALNTAKSAVDPESACSAIAEALGDTEFPVPDPKDTGVQTSAPAIVTSSSSA